MLYLAFFFLLVCDVFLISCSVITKDKLQSQCCEFHAIADKAKYPPSILSHWTISTAVIEPVADRIEGNAPQTDVFIR